ncbi:carboxypeptidase regulatory-like domain-containing protein [Lutibacter sp.]
MKPLKLIVSFILIVNLFAKSEAKQSTALYTNSSNYTPITLEKKLNTKINTIIFQPSSFEEGECLQTITGKIRNKLSGEILNNTIVTLYLNGEENKSLKVGVDGVFNFKIKCDSNYYIKTQKLNFINDIYEFKTTSKNNKIIIHDFVLEPECIQTISGNILDKETKKPVSANLKLYINNVEVETFKIEDDGSYFIKFQCVTNYRIVASKPYYFNDSYYFLTDYIENKQPNYFHLKKDLFLKRNDCYQQISGTILDVNTHTIIPNSTVSLYYQNTKIKSFHTTENGSYSFKANCNLNYELRIFKDNNFVKTINVKTSSLKNIKQNIYLGVANCKQVINGMVISKKTKARLINTQITLFEGKTKIKKITTDGNGTFSFGLNCNSSYKIVANNRKYFTTSINFDTEATGSITLNKTIELNLLDCSQTLNGIVLDKITKLPIANTQVILLERGNEVLKKLTNDTGKFFFKVNCASKYEIVTAHKQYKTNSIKLSINKARNTTNSISFNLEKKDCIQTITGIIRDKTTKKPLPNTTISLYQNNNVINSYTVGEDGIYTLKLNCSSTYKLSVFKNNYLESFQLKTNTQNNQILNLNIDIEPLICENYIKGVVKENITNNPIPNTSVLLKFNSKEVKQTITDSIGTFYFNAKCNKPYTVFVTKLNYTKAKQTILLSDKNNLDYNLNLSIEPIIPFKEKNGIKYIETKPIIFGLDEFKINTKIKLELNKVVYNMNQNPFIKIEINYYTDSRGPDDYNLQLSIKRANATKDYLISKGIDSNRIKATGFGETKLLNKCENNVKCSDAEHAINRRTEFIVTKK